MAARNVAMALVVGLGCLSAPAAFGQERYDGFNVVASAGHPFGSASARRALAKAHRLGASAVAIIPFLWQAGPAETHIVRGSDMTNDMLRTAIRDAHAAGLRVMVKPHVWVPGTWAGAVEPETDADWKAWFGNYRAALIGIARIAAEEQADALAIGTELSRTTNRPQWVDLIAAARAAFPRKLIYFAHNLDEANGVPFWPLLDAVGVTLYPSLGRDDDRVGRRAAMADVARQLDGLAEQTGKQVIVGEIGLRSAEYAASKPWESPEERPASVDDALQAEVLADWLAALERPSVRGVLIWRWFTDPDAGGPNDTDFTVQNKMAEGVLLCAWVTGCTKR